MPLQVEMEEGPRSESDHFSGLQYCQYSQEKISLITLLSDHVRTMPNLLLKYRDWIHSCLSPPSIDVSVATYSDLRMIERQKHGSLL